MQMNSLSAEHYSLKILLYLINTIIMCRSYSDVIWKLLPHFHENVE